MKTITVVGGGLAGLTVGIGLRQRGVPVIVWEAGHYPRHRVCGEFISGRGQETLARLGVCEKLEQAGAIPARTAAFFSSRAASPVRELSQPAISISRFVLDELLAAEFRRLGGELREHERWRDGEFREGTVRAGGRRIRPVVNGWRWFGLKVHARNVPLKADLEMHLSSSGYLGMSRLRDGEVNLCGLFRRPAHAADAPLHWQEILRGSENSVQQERLRAAKFDEDSFCSVAGLSLTPHRAAGFEECCVGDAITMIPPVTGNGMSMAFESAEMAIAPLAEYSAGKISWAETHRIIARNCDTVFAKRLVWADWLQWALFMPSLQPALMMLLRSRWMWNLFFEKTR